MRRKIIKVKQTGGVPGLTQSIGRGRLYAVLALAGVLLVGAVPTTWAQVPTSAKDYVLTKVADLAEKTGNAELASQLLSSLSEAAQAEALGATYLRNESNVSNFAQLGLLDGDTPADAVKRHGYEYQKIQFTTTTPVSWQNKTGETIWVSNMRTFLVGTASSALYISAGVSSVTGVAYNSTTEPRGLLDRAFTATNTVNAAFDHFRYQTDGDTPTGTPKYFPIAPNQYLLVYLRTQDPKWAVTSTANMGLAATSYVAWDYLIDSTSTDRSR